MCSLPRDIRFTFKGIWEVCADDFGRFLADSRVIKGEVWPMDDDVTTKKIERFVLALADCGRIQLYKVCGVRYGVVVNWYKHQRVSHPTPSRFPEPLLPQRPNDSGAIPENFRSDSALNGAEGIGEERNRSGAEARDEPSVPLPADLALPKGVLDFLAMFYEPALTERQRDRYRDIVSQLLDTVDPRHPGPKIRGGIRVKARGRDHLEQCCRAVMKDPPMDRDKAVVFVLKRLTDPEPGPTISERHKASESDRIALEDGYQRAAKSAGVAWSRDHPAEYEPIRVAVEAEFSKAGENSFSRSAKEAALTQRCSKAAGFPDFETWRKERQETAA